MVDLISGMTLHPWPLQARGTAQVLIGMPWRWKRMPPPLPESLLVPRHLHRVPRTKTCYINGPSAECSADPSPSCPPLPPSLPPPRPISHPIAPRKSSPITPASSSPPPINILTFPLAYLVAFSMRWVGFKQSKRNAAKLTAWRSCETPTQDSRNLFQRNMLY